jgi:CubicO group peptidase (beta-lactamase class C family)
MVVIGMKLVKHGFIKSWFGVLFSLVFLLLLVIPLTQATKTDYPTLVPDYWPTEDWRTADPEDHGINMLHIHAMEEYIEDIGWGFALRSTLIIRNGYLVYENYFGYPERMNETQNIYSCTKSVSSILVGIAIAEGYIASVDELLIDLLSSRVIANLDEWKQAITLEYLLSMTSGLPWDEWEYSYSNPENDWNEMTGSPDWVQFVLDRPMEYAPGTHWVYNTGGSHLLSAIVTEATGNFTNDYAESRLFTPLGITDFLWLEDPQGIANGGSSLYLRPRDLAKIGYLYLQNGTWDGQQIVPASWVYSSTFAHSELDSETSYGYQWWLHPPWGCYGCKGYLSQYVYVFPALDMVVIFTARTNSVEDHKLLEDYILPSVGVISTIPSNSFSDILALATIGILVTIPVVGSITYLVLRRRKNR